MAQSREAWAQIKMEEDALFTIKAKIRLRWLDELYEDMKDLGIKNWKETANDLSVCRSHVQQANAYKEL